MPEFEAARDAVTYTRESFEARLPTGNPELARASDAAVADYLNRLGHDDVVARLRKLLVEQLTLGEPTLKDVARRLGVSQRSLQRRLDAEQTSYRGVLENTRHELALSYMGDFRYSITDIAYLLGFGSATSFGRAFVRWTGEQPRIYRARLIQRKKGP
jgi:AraC-like DNA-binding protein